MRLFTTPPRRCVPGDYVRGPVHLTQFYGVIIGVILIFTTFWALSRRRAPGYVFWHFVLWYSVLRSVLEETFRDNPLSWNLYLSEGLREPGIGLFTLTQLVSIPIILVALYMLLTLSSETDTGAHASGDPQAVSAAPPAAPLAVVVLAGGPGHAHEVCFAPSPCTRRRGRPLVEHVVRAALPLEPDKLIVVVGHGAELVKARLDEYPMTFVTQTEQRGTGARAARGQGGITRF